MGDPDTSQHWTQPSSFPAIKCHLPVTTSATVIMTEEMPLPQSGGQKEQAAKQEGPSLPVPILSIVTPAYTGKGSWPKIHRKFTLDVSLQYSPHWTRTTAP